MANGPEGAVLPEAGMAANVTGQPQPAPCRRRTFFRVSVRGLLLLINGQRGHDRGRRVSTGMEVRTKKPANCHFVNMTCIKWMSL